jgi:hypothetical protein
VYAIAFDMDIDQLRVHDAVESEMQNESRRLERTGGSAQRR